MEGLEKQYGIFNGDVRIPVGSTEPRLKASFYDLASAMGTYGIRPMSPVTDDLIDIPGSQADEVMRDIAQFLATKERYEKCGLTHKRGYLFYGPPGTGKSSLTTMLAKRFIKDADGLVFNVNSTGHLSIMTNIVKRVEPGRPSMFIMEEADHFVNDPGALSILDGEQSMAGAVFVAVTNYKSKLPPRIANRPGRFDRVVFIGAPARGVQVEYFKRLLGRLGEDLPGVEEKLADSLEGISISMGHLREAFIAHVLMQVPLAEVRRRFEAMSDVKDEPDQSSAGESDTADDECDNCGRYLDDAGICTNSDCDSSPNWQSSSC